MITVKAHANRAGVLPRPLFDHDRYRPIEREIAIRRIERARLEKYIVPRRTLPKRPINVPHHRDEFEKLEKELKAQTSILPRKRDRSYDIPRWWERIKRAAGHKVFRWAGREKGMPTVYEAHNVQGKEIRNSLADFGPECMKTIMGATWERHDWTKANHVELEVRHANMESPMPTHFLRITANKESESGAPNLFTPIHAAFMRAYWAKMGDLPEYVPMDICTPVDKNGVEMPQNEFARGELPCINVHVDNLESMPHIIAYMYQRSPTWFLQQILGPNAIELLPFENRVMDWEQRSREWSVAKGLAFMYRKQTLFEHLNFLEELNNNANDLGMDDEGFWWAMDVALRILLDAVVMKDRIEERDKNGDIDTDSESGSSSGDLKWDEVAEQSD